MLQRFLLVIVCSFSAALVVEATPQIPDVLVYKGAEYPIHNDPLADYFKRYPERKPESDWVCSALWRGYVATFEIVDGSLVLKDIVADACNTPKPVLEKVVPDRKRLVIDWYTGILISMHGRNDADPYGLKWLESAEKYSLFEIDAGRLGGVKHLDNSGFHNFRRRQFAAYKETAEYKQELKKLTENDRMSVSNADANMITWLFWNTKKFLVE
jgi:hypothetical protein